MLRVKVWEGHAKTKIHLKRVTSRSMSSSQRFMEHRWHTFKHLLDIPFLTTIGFILLTALRLVHIYPLPFIEDK